MRTHFLLSENLVSIDEFKSLLQFDNCGAEAIFMGVVRNTNQSKIVTHLEFEAYSPMFYMELNKIAEQLRLQFDFKVIALHHRKGIVAAGEMAVIAGISSTHRQDAFLALAELMNQLKKTVPIWKKEVYTDGNYWLSSTP